MNTRSLGIFATIGGLALLVIEVRHLITGVELSGATIDRMDSLLYAAWAFGLAGASWAMYSLCATGNKTWMRLVAFVPLLGSVALLIGSVLEVLGLVTPKTDLVAGLGWIMILLGMLLAGIFALIARTWAGWRKVMPIVCFLSTIVGLALSSVVGNGITVLVALSYLLLGVAVFTTSQKDTALGQAPTAAR
jgi:hypothetical protein